MTSTENPSDQLSAVSASVSGPSDPLAQQHPLPADAHLAFAEEGHQYTAWGQQVQRSTTKLIESCFEQFDGAGCVETYYEDTWKANPKSKYHARIHAALAAGMSEEEVKASIRAAWEAEGAEARRLGTALHLHCELDLNGHAPVPHPELAAEIDQYEQFKASAFVAERGLKPYRTELSVAYRADDGVVVCAGRVDALFVDAAGAVYLVDFKRSKHKLGGKQHGFWDAKRRVAAMGRGVATHLADTHFHRYSLQLACYALMLRQSQGVDVAERCYLLRMHPSLSKATPTYELVQCKDLCVEALTLFHEEHQRLLEEKSLKKI
jgi:ATP-dependent exoDNAse (exonuclease V) beta subunit